MRKPRPTDVEIELALSRSNGSGRGAARILGCSPKVISEYVHAQLKKGRLIGRVRWKSNIETPVTDDTPCHPLTEGERMTYEMVRDYFAEELAS